MNRNVQSLLLVAVGGVLAWVAVDGGYLKYVKGTALPWLIAAAMTLVFVGLVLLWADNEHRLAARMLSAEELANRPQRQPAAESGHGHGHHRAAMLVPWFLVLPLFALFLVQPRELGAYTAERNRPAKVQEPPELFDKLPATDPVPMGLLELNQRAEYGGTKELTGRTLEFTGFVTPTTTSRPGEFYVNRLLISCCAADAVPIRTRVTGSPQRFTKGTWVRVTGSYTGKDRAADSTIGSIPVVEITDIRKTPVPKKPYAN